MSVLLCVSTMEVLCIIGLIVAVLFLGDHYLHNYWTRRGFKQLSPKFFVGDIGDLFRLKKSIAEVYGDLYERSKKLSIVGIYFTYRPGLLINDPELIRKILVKDFHHFTDHGLYVDEKHDPLSGHLFSLSGDKWKNLRAKLSPLFSPVKLKLMFPTFHDCAMNLQKHVEGCISARKEVIEMRELLARYTTDVIASVAFGFDSNSINNPESIFRVMGAKVFKPTFKAGLRGLMTFLMPQVNKYIGMKVADQDVEDFMFTMVKQTIEFREKTNQQRNDFMQMMIKLKNGGLVDGDEAQSSNDKLTLEQVVAQAFVFFIAAFETTSATMALCLYELSKNKCLQQKVHNEIDRVTKRNSDELVNYDLMMELKYLECCIDETLRKYPPAPFLIRECTKSYAVPSENVTIEKGTPIIISAFGLHRDPEIFDDPLVWSPERFLSSPTGEGRSSGLFYVPFGDGPRNCIGMRMGKLAAKLGLFMLLSKFEFEIDGGIPEGELKFSPKQFVLTLEDNMNLRVGFRNFDDIRNFDL